MLLAAARRSRILIAFAVILVGAGAGAGVAYAGAFKTGIYKGATSQGDELVLRLVSSACVHGHGPCLIAVTPGFVKLTCPNGESNEYIDPAYVHVPPNGRIHYSSVSSNGAKTTETILVKHNGTIIGSYSIVGFPDSIDQAEATGTCSATVSYTLRRA